MSKHKGRNAIIWLVLLLALAYYILDPEPVNQVIKRVWNDEQVEELKGLANVASEFKLADVKQSEYKKYLLPKHDSEKEIVNHFAYTLQYNEKHEQADWVAYLLTKEKLEGKIKRKDNFRADKSITSGSASLKDYKRSGFDRGHLAPAADMKWSEQAMSESFFMSNMSPQKPRFNRGVWKDLEAQVRAWAKKENEVFIVTGPILTDEVKHTIGDNNVTVPNQYYKIILDMQEPEIKAIGFVLPNKKGDKPLNDYAMSVDEVEKITGIDFFEKLPDKYENKIESEYNPALWW